jgi:hypothetical protein
MYLKLSTISKFDSAANPLLIRIANYALLIELVLIPELLSQWSAFPVKNIAANFTLLSIGVSARLKHFALALSTPLGFHHQT